VPWIQLTVQIILGLLTIAASGVVTHRLNARKDQQEFMRTKLEVLFDAVRGFGKTYSSSMIVWISVMDGKIPYDKGQDIHNEATKDKPDDFGTIEMIVNIYFPELNFAFQSLVTERNRANSVLAQFNGAVKADKPTDRFARVFTQTLLDLDKAEEFFKEQICIVSRKFNPAVAKVPLPLPKVPDIGPFDGPGK
jgi:hypothetical protein